MIEILENGKEYEEYTQKDRFLTFTLGNENYGVEIDYVTEIIGFRTITTVPEQPNFVKAIINSRGDIIPVMDMRLRFKKEELPYCKRTCVIIIEIPEGSIGLIVDGVSDVITIPEKDIVDSTPQNKTLMDKFVNRIGKVGSDVKLILDWKHLLVQEDIPDLSKAV